jgi:cobalt-zinc-cadmium efflux system membrane fusion protein
MKRYSVLIITGCTILAAACGKKEEKKVEQTNYVLSDSMQRMIVIDSVREGNISDEVSLSGEVNFNENTVVKVFPRSSGQVREAPVSLGDHVNQGQVLAVIRSADIAGNYSDLSSANADLAIAKRQMDNAQSLYKNGMSSEREYTEAKQNYEKALAAKNKVQSLISINGGSNSSAAGQYVLTAPIDGYIVEKKITAGSFLRSDAADNLFTISDLKNVWVEANVYESDIQKVKEGFPVAVKVLAYKDRVFNGRIDKLSQVLDPQSKALRARISIDNKEMLLKPDMFAKVTVSSVVGDAAVYVPSDALIDNEGRTYVVVYNGNNDLKIAQVKVLKTTDNKTFVYAGVTPGQRVITKFQNLIFTELLSR